MLKKLLIGLTKPQFKYEILEGSLPEIVTVPEPKVITLFIYNPWNRLNSLNFPVIGDIIKAGQKISLDETSENYVISTASGKIIDISSYLGNFGKEYISISIEVYNNQEFDSSFSAVKDIVSLDNAINYLKYIPGNQCFDIFQDPSKNITTIVINGADSDINVLTNQFIFKTQLDKIKDGIEYLKKITGINNIILILPEPFIASNDLSGMEVKGVNTLYPSALPDVITEKILNIPVLPGKTSEDSGVCYFSLEAVVSIGLAFKNGEIPFNKTITIVKKNGSKYFVNVKIGTPIKDIFNALEISANDKDRIIFGGLMTGFSIFSLDYPVQPCTDAIIIQDKEIVSQVSDYPCINCGECVRICPAKVPVNMLIRLLEVKHYEDALDMYDLDSCIECGLCSIVCVSKIPIFQYIKLAKYELAQIELEKAKISEEVDAK